MVKLDDRVSDVLARDPRLLEVFVSASPAFEALRDGSAMSRLVTVEQAARVAGMEPERLRRRLDAALGLDVPEQPEEEPPARALPPIPEHVRALAPHRAVDLDVREDLAAGREPFGAISEAARALPEGHALRVRAPFGPAPLYAAMRKRGLDHHTEQLAEEDWRVWFVHAEGDAAAPPAPPDEPPAPAPEPCQVVIDVRGLEPPEPMVRTFEALRTLPEDVTLVQINERVPRFLLPKLHERGFEYEAHEADDGTVRVHIRHRRKERA